jgi:hypothetical protein
LLAAHDGDNQSFLSEDPLAGVADTPPSLHRYLYAYDNPTVFFDPNGEATVEVFGRKIEVPDVAVDWTLYQLGRATGFAEQVQQRVQGLHAAATSNSLESTPVIGELAREARIGFERNGRLIQAFREDGFEGLERERQHILTEAIDDAKTKLRQLPIVRLNAPIAEAFDAQARGSSFGVGRAQARLAVEATEDALLVAGTAAAVQSAAARTPAMAARAAIVEETAAADVAAAQNAARAQGRVAVESATAPRAASAGALDPAGAASDIAPGFSTSPATTAIPQQGRTLIVPRAKAANMPEYQAAAEQGRLIRTDPKTVRGPGFRKRVEAEKGAAPGSGYQADHVVELCVGGPDCAKTNAQWLRSQPNQSAGGKIGAQVKNDPPGTRYTKVELEEEPPP